MAATSIGWPPPALRCSSPAGVNGEFFSLTLEEVPELVRIAKQAARGRPVVAGCGYGTAIAVELARAAVAAGADGVLLLPPYLVAAEPQGLIAHVGAVASAVDVGVIVYNRDNCVLGPEALRHICDAHDNVIGVKDGHGDLALASAIIQELRGRAVYLCGLPTAEVSAPTYKKLGADNYTSGVCNFLPAMSLRFHQAVQTEDAATVAQLTADFFGGFIAQRDSKKASLIPMVKGGVRAVGRNPGVVRPPLVDLTADEQAALAALIGKVS